MLELILAWRNIWRHRRRTWLTIGAMVFCNILLVFMISLQHGTYQMMIDNTLQMLSGHIQLQAPGYVDEPGMRKTLNNVQALAQTVREQHPESHVAARAMGFALLSSEERSYGVQIIGVEPAYEKTVSTLPGLLKEGRYLESETEAALVVGSALARNLKINVGDEVTVLGSGWDGSFAADVLTVVGTFDAGIGAVERALAVMPVQRMQETFALGHRGHAVVLLNHDFNSVDSTFAQLHNTYTDNSDIAVVHWNDLQPGLKQAIQADMTTAWFMYGLLIVLVAFSVMNTQLMSVLERTREFGVVMALGLRARRLMRLILFESALMAAVGMALGVVLGAILVAYLQHNGFTYPGLDEMADKFNLEGRIYPSLSFNSATFGPAIIFISSIIASIYPALHLRSLNPIAAMRAV